MQKGYGRREGLGYRRAGQSYECRKHEAEAKGN